MDEVLPPPGKRQIGPLKGGLWMNDPVVVSWVKTVAASPSLPETTTKCFLKSHVLEKSHFEGSGTCLRTSRDGPNNPFNSKIRKWPFVVP